MTPGIIVFIVAVALVMLRIGFMIGRVKINKQTNDKLIEKESIRKDIGTVVKDIIEHPGNWFQTEYIFTDGTIQLWTANGASHLRFYEDDVDQKNFTDFEKNYVWKVVEDNRRLRRTYTGLETTINPKLRDIARDMLENHRSWKQERHVFSKEDTGVVFKTPDRINGIAFDPETYKLSLAEQYFIGKAIGDSNLQNILCQMQKGNCDCCKKGRQAERILERTW